jgi:hypothetical protein
VRVHNQPNAAPESSLAQLDTLQSSRSRPLEREVLKENHGFSGPGRGSGAEASFMPCGRSTRDVITGSGRHRRIQRARHPIQGLAAPKSLLTSCSRVPPPGPLGTVENRQRGHGVLPREAGLAWRRHKHQDEQQSEATKSRSQSGQPPRHPAFLLLMACPSGGTHQATNSGCPVFCKGVQTKAAPDWGFRTDPRLEGPTASHRAFRRASFF